MRIKGNVIQWKGSHLNLKRSYREWVVWCGQKCIATGRTKAETLANLRAYLGEVERGNKVLGQ